MQNQVSSQGKKIDTLEAQVADLKSQAHRLINEKLALINGSPRETTEVNEKEEAPVREAPVPKGKTL